MADAVSIKVFGDEHFRHKIQKMSLRAAHAEPVMDAIGHDLITIIEEQFDTQGGRGGHPWKKLEIETIARRGSAYPILIDTGELFDELITPGHIHTSDSSVELKLPEAVLQKAESAQYGFTSRAGKKIRPRKIIDLTTFDRKHFRNKISRWLTHGEL